MPVTELTEEEIPLSAPLFLLGSTQTFSNELSWKENVVRENAFHTSGEKQALRQL